MTTPAVPRPFYLTTPIYYASGPPHIGHAYATILGDAIARYERGQRGPGNVLFLTGTDEHGRKIQKAAEEAGLPLGDFVDRTSRQYQVAWDILHVGDHQFIRTTSGMHRSTVAQVWEKLAASGDIYLGEYEGLYCEGCEAFVTEKDLLPGGICPDHRTRAEKVREESYFFRLSRYRDKLLALYGERPGFVTPSTRMAEVRGRVERGLSDLSISRTSCKWGIPVPGNPDHAVYVWFDALFSYFSGAVIHQLCNGDAGPPRFWPNQNAPVYHLVGKEIVFFHAVYWPAFLMALGSCLPEKIVSHGWWTVDGEKMSKSRGNVVNPAVLARHLGADAVRYFLLREVPVGEDGDISHGRFLSRYNDELCNDLGNLLNRTLIMVEKFSGGALLRGSHDAALMDHACEGAACVREAMAKMQVSGALEAIFSIVRSGNAFLEEKAPFRLVKTDPEKAAEVLYNAADLLRVIAGLLRPFMPERAEEMLRQLGLTEDCDANPVWGGIPSGTAVRRGPVLFPRLSEEEVIAAWRAATGSLPAR